MTFTMKANRTIVLSKDDRAEVGVGTLIVFIAMVLVAAVAAAVLINTSGTLQERAQSTGKEATQEVSSNLRLVGVYGNRTGTSGNLEAIKLNVELAAGAQQIDMTKLIIRYSDGSSQVNYIHAAAASTTAFDPEWIRGDGESTNVMQPGDLVELEFWLGTSLAPRKNVEILLIPESGTPVIADFTTPPTYGTDKTITLR